MKGVYIMNQFAFITGADSGIGLATAEALASDGYDIVLAARNEKKLRDAQKKIQAKFSVEAAYFVLDVRDTSEIHKTVEECLEKFGTPTVLVNDAGLARGLEPYEKTEEQDINEMIDTNIRGLFMMTHAFLPAMVRRNSGHIINLGSTAGLYAYAGAAVYCATKAAVKTFSDGIRIDLIDTDIKVTTIQPGIVQTDFSRVRFHNDEKRAAQVYEGIEALQAGDIADVIRYVIHQPRRVQISDVVIMANQQATGFMVSKKK